MIREAPVPRPDNPRDAWVVVPTLLLLLCLAGCTESPRLVDAAADCRSALKPGISLSGTEVRELYRRGMGEVRGLDGRAGERAWSEPPGWVQRVQRWLHQHRGTLGRLGVVSLATFVLSLLAMPLVVILLPEDYFVRHQRLPVRKESPHPFVWRFLSLLKNLFGGILILGGIAMLVLPGQGILTILIGLALTNFPGKYALERYLVSRPGVHRALDAIRKKAGKAPFQHPE